MRSFLKKTGYIFIYICAIAFIATVGEAIHSNWIQKVDPPSIEKAIDTVNIRFSRAAVSYHSNGGVKPTKEMYCKAVQYKLVDAGMNYHVDKAALQVIQYVSTDTFLDIVNRKVAMHCSYIDNIVTTLLGKGVES